MVKLNISRFAISILLFFSLIVVVVIAWLYFYKINPSITSVRKSDGIFGRNVYQNTQTTNLGSLADRNYQLTFPKDHASHPKFDIEWWYLTANLSDNEGDEYGLQWTLFRFKNPSERTQQVDQPWHNDQMFMAHASVHSLDEHWFLEKFARGGVGNATTSISPFTLSIDDWQWENSANSSSLLPAKLQFKLPNITKHKFEELSVSLNLTQTGPLILQGEKGYSIKSGSSAHASHYYSAPFIAVDGTFTIKNNDTDEIRLKQVSGNAWFDQEWTSQLLDQQTLGWDWFSLHLNDGAKVMAFRMRLANESDYVTGSYITAAGKKTTLHPNDLTLSPSEFIPLNDKYLPLMWKLDIPSKKINLSIRAKKRDQWNPALVAYYEGMVAISGTHTGSGFIELTGY